jgi:hypothetical protein
VGRESAACKEPRGGSSSGSLALAGDAERLPGFSLPIEAVVAAALPKQTCVIVRLWPTAALSSVGFGADRRTAASSGAIGEQLGSSRPGAGTR